MYRAYLVPLDILVVYDRRLIVGAYPRPRVLVTDQKLSDAYDILNLLEVGVQSDSKGDGFRPFVGARAS